MKLESKYIIYWEFLLIKYLINNKSQIEKINENLFYNDLSKIYFNAVKELFLNNEELTENNIKIKIGKIDPSIILPTDLLENLEDIDINQKSFEDLISIIKEYKKNMQLKKNAETILEIFRNLEETTFTNLDDRKQAFETVQKKIRISLENISNFLSNGDDTFKPISEYFEEYPNILERRINEPNYSYGDENLDNLIPRGPYPGSITTIMGSTGMGKSTVALHIFNCCLDKQIPCIYFSLEMSSEVMLDRLIARRYKYTLQDLLNKEYLPSIKTQIEKYKEQLRQLDFAYFDDCPSLTLNELKARILEFKRKTKKDYAIVIVDLLTQLKDFSINNNGMNLAQSMEIGMNRLNELAKELGVHFIGVVQTNRKTDDVKISVLEDVFNLRPILRHIKNAAAIEERSRVVLGVFRPRYYIDKYLPESEQQRADQNDYLELLVLKQNDGKTGRTAYLFNSNYFELAPLSEFPSYIMESDKRNGFDTIESGKRNNSEKSSKMIII